MFDTMTLTKAVASICGALLIFLFGTWASDAIYGGKSAEGHEGEEIAQAYSIDTGATETAAATTAEGPDFATLYASADAAAGEKVFGKCKACHKVDGSNGTGPHLNGVVDRPKASVAGFAYSDAIMALSAESWSPDKMFAFLENPKGYMPGTKMGFAGLAKPEDRVNVIAYLATMK
jgi:cytochrome c